MRTLILSFIALSVVWTRHLVHAQIVVGCFQDQPDSNTGVDSKTFQDIFMSHGACTTFCKNSNAAYAIASAGSTCHCSNTPPLDSNKVDDSKCDKPCMGYPFEMCGGSSSAGLANVLLIGSSVVVPSSSSLTSNNNPGTSSSSSSTIDNGGAFTNNPSPTTAQPDSDPKSKNNSDIANGGKALNANSPGMLPPPPVPGPTPTIVNRYNREKKKSGQNVTSSEPVDEDAQNSGSEGTGTITAAILSVLGFGVLFAIAVVFNKRRRARLAQEAWTESMLLPSSLIHSSNNDDELEGHDYTRATPIYNNNANKHMSVISSTNMHFPPPPALHPRQSGALQMQQSSYGSHYNMRGPFQPFPMPPMQQQYDHMNLNHKEPLTIDPSPYVRAPHTLQEQSPFEDEEQEPCEMILSRPSVRSVRLIRRESAHSDTVEHSVGGLRYYHPNDDIIKP
ncbi:hypothetical protein BGZ46_010225 [Entomortierella lignicola]|nr:hypothetical protein BGZ46_010225 [Entomortierella lignicola]